MKQKDNKPWKSCLSTVGGIIGLVTIAGLCIAVLQLWQSLSETRSQGKVQETLIAISANQLAAQQTLVSLQQNSASPQQLNDIQSTISALENERLNAQATLSPGLSTPTTHILPTPQSTLTDAPSPTNTLESIYLITGVWDFDFFLKRIIGSDGFIRDSNNFYEVVARLNQNGTRFSGEYLGASVGNVCIDVNIDGTVTGNRAEWVVRYTGSCCQNESVKLVGTLNSDGSVIEGTVEPVDIPSGSCSLWYGDFTATRR